jgi:hypothetical protein
MQKKASTPIHLTEIKFQKQSLLNTLYKNTIAIRCPLEEVCGLLTYQICSVVSRVTKTKTRVRIGNWIYWIITGRNYKFTQFTISPH